jgi:eukaryotic-like serine/threonine-protein kinase
MTDLEGKTLGRYELLQLTGRGGMADVYLGYDPNFDRDVAIKIFKREDEDLLRRFLREARLMASLSNTHLMPVYDTGTSILDGVPTYYIVMPFMRGGTLRDRIRNSPLPLNESCQYLRNIADALDYMHQHGIIHRDIKASNILLDDAGNCYLADFGIARASNESTQMTTTGSVLGTVDYIAPELFETNIKANERSDFYSLGVLLYEMVTGHLPFTAENQIAVVAMHVNKQPPSPREYIPNLPLPVERVMLRALEKRPERRYASAAELADAFCRAITAPVTAETYIVNQNDVAALPTRRMYQQSQPMPAVTGAFPTSQQYVQQNYSSTGNYPAAPVYPPPYQNGGGPDPDERKQSGLGTALVIILLLAIIGSTAYFLLRSQLGTSSVQTPTPTAAPNLAATAQSASATAQQQKNATSTVTSIGTATAKAKAQTNATATANARNAANTAHANATATAKAQANATATANANATATPGVIQTAVAGNPVYQDALNNANNGATQGAQWDSSTGTPPVQNCVFQADGYHVIGTIGQAFQICHEAAKAFNDFAVQVNISIQQGSAGGVLFRLNGNGGYLFEVDATGRYSVVKSTDFTSGNMTALQDWTNSSAVKTGTQENQLQLIAKGGTLLFYVNGTFLKAITDTTFSSGVIGFAASAGNNGGAVNVVCSNLNIYGV